MLVNAFPLRIASRLPVTEAAAFATIVSMVQFTSRTFSTRASRDGDIVEGVGVARETPEAGHTSFRFALLPGFDSGLDCLELNASRFEVVVGNFPGKRLEFPCVPAAAEVGMQFFD